MMVGALVLPQVMAGIMLCPASLDRLAKPQPALPAPTTMSSHVFFGHLPPDTLYSVVYTSGRAETSPDQTGNAVVLNTVRNAKDDCICATPGRRVRYWRWMRAKSSVSSATTLRM